MLTTIAEFRAALAEEAAASAGPGAAGHPTIGLVPTMGALHSGHGELLQAARESADVVVASVFVNPLQFDDDADFLHYPRQLDADVALLAEHGADLVFAPELDEMYPGHPEGPLVRVSAGELGRRWEGASRPGHFDGMVTVVNKLFTICSGGLAGSACVPRLEAWFGVKDAEQLAIITRMVADFDHRVRIRSLPIVRDENGLALSSRNQRLSDSDYAAALALPRAIFTLRDRAAAGEPLGVDELRDELARTPGVEPDYLVVVDPLTLRELPPGGESETRAPGVSGLEAPALDPGGVLRGEALALVAAWVGPVRLIDNMRLASV